MDNNVLKNKTLLVIIVTLLTMVAEIAFGIITNSMALTADGFHMGTHAFALSITFAVCVVVNRYQNKEEVLNALGGYTSALFLGLSAFGILYESVVTFIGLVVNAVCILIMSDHHIHCHGSAGHHHEHSENLNFKAAYMHILADALTSVAAIVALTAAKYFGWVFLDPLTGVVGGLIILKWSVGLIKQSFLILVK